MRTNSKAPFVRLIGSGARRLGCVLALGTAVCLVAFSSAASASLTLCSYGSGAGQCVNPQGIAVDRSSDQVYVADAGNNRIDVFTSSGSFRFAFGWGVADGTTNAPQSCGPSATPPTATCFQGISGSGAGQFANLRHIAVDNNPSSPAFHDVYAVSETPPAEAKDPPKFRIQRFSPAGAFILKFGEGVINSNNDPITVGPDGTVYVGEGGNTPKLYKFTPAGVPAGSSALPGPALVWDIAIDSKEDVYVDFAGSDFIEKYEPTEPNATSLFSLDAGANTRALAVDSADNLFAAQLDGVRVITEHDSSGKTVRRFGYGEIDFNLNGVAVGSAGEIFGAEEYAGVPSPGNRVIRVSQPAPGPFLCCLQTTLGNTKVTLKGRFNPEGKDTTYHFDYVTEAAFKINGFSGAASTSESTPVGADFTLHDIEAAIGCTEPPQPSCLVPDTDYRYRLVAKNEDGENFSEGTFKTLPPFEIVATYATDVGTDGAVLHTTVNPFGIPATGYLEYVDDAAYQADIAEGHDGFSAAIKVPNVDGGSPPLDFGAGQTPKAASAVLSTLTPGATYHYRAVITDSFVSEAGPERTLTVFTPPKPGSGSCPNQAFRTGASASLPDCRAYEMVSPVDKNGGDIKVLLSGQGYLARLEQSAADGSSFAFSSVTGFGDAVSAPYTSQYQATRKAGDSWTTQAISPPREPKSIDGAFFRFDSQYRVFAPDLSSGWLFFDSKALDACAPEGFMNIYRRDSASGGYEALNTAKPAGAANGFVPELQSLSADGSHAAFRANAKLTSNASSALNADGLPVYQLYEHVRGEGCGELRLVSVLPNGKAFAGPSSAGSSNLGVRGESRVNAVARAVSTDGSRIFWTALSTVSEGAIYLRIDGAETVQITAANNAHLWTSSTDGSKAIYTIGEELYEAAIPGNTSTSTLIAKGVRGVVGASEDASRLYFVSTEALGGEGKAGQPNLYLREGVGVPHFVATLYGGDSNLPSGDLNVGFEEFGFAIAQSSPLKNGVRVSADGSHLAFVSAGSLTGYDNTDTAEGLPDLEVYLYDTTTDHLACISCNPSGARPSGRLFGLGAGTGSESRRVSAKLAPGENQNFTPRSLSADGNRLFFESFEALLPRDTNGKEDVYEWEKAGSQGECDEHGAELYVSSAGGCLSLISSGQSPSDSELADASPDGSDVFIRTQSSLLVQDPGQVDIYDARIGGGLPAPKVPVPSCEGEACQGPLAPPSDPTPASSAFEGAGNVNEAVAARCGKGKVARKGRCVAKKGRKTKQQTKQTKHAKQTKHNRRAGR